MKKKIEVIKKKIEIKEISIKIGDKTITLSPDEARTLKDELSKVFGDSRYYYPVYITQPVQVIPAPYYPSYPQIWCGGLGSCIGQATGINPNSYSSSGNQALAQAQNVGYNQALLGTQST